MIFYNIYFEWKHGRIKRGGVGMYDLVQETASTDAYVDNCDHLNCTSRSKTFQVI